MLPVLNGLLSRSNSIPVTSGPGPCVKCKSQPQAQDPTTGQCYLFCSNTCAAPRTLKSLPTSPSVVGGPNKNGATNASANTRSASALPLCTHCGKRPRYGDGAVVHPYCGRTCANLANGKGHTNGNAPVPTSPIRTTNPFIATNPFTSANPFITTNPFTGTNPFTASNPFIAANPFIAPGPPITTNPFTISNPSVATDPPNDADPSIVTYPWTTSNPCTAASPSITTDPSIVTNPSKTATRRNTTDPLGTAASTNDRNKSIFTKKHVPDNANLRNGVTPTNSTNTQNDTSSINRKTSSGPICLTPGCSSPVHVFRNGIASKYCTRAHSQWEEHGCISCRKAPMDSVTVFCQSCYGKVLRVAPTIVQVPGDHERYKSVATLFQKKWTHNTQCPEIRAIYKIVSTTTSLKKYERDKVEAKGNFASQNKPRGNEKSRWNGATRKCNIGDEGIAKLCSYPSCSLCRIIKTSFDLSFLAKKSNQGRFGVGIYTSSTSSRSDRYSRNKCTSNWRAMLLNRVVAGKGYKMTVDNSALTKPPAGYDSVLAEVGAGSSDDEFVVYDSDAIQPLYLVMYDIPR